MTTLTQSYATYAHRLSEIGLTPDTYVCWLEAENERLQDELMGARLEDAEHLVILSISLGLPRGAEWDDVMQAMYEFIGDGK